MPNPFEWTFPEWMKKYLDILPNMVGQKYTREKQIERIEWNMNVLRDDLEENPWIYGPGDIEMWVLITGKIRLLEALHRNGYLKDEEEPDRSVQPPEYETLMEGYHDND